MIALRTQTTSDETCSDKATTSDETTTSDKATTSDKTSTSDETRTSDKATTSDKTSTSDETRTSDKATTSDGNKSTVESVNRDLCRHLRVRVSQSGILFHGSPVSESDSRTRFYYSFNCHLFQLMYLYVFVCMYEQEDEIMILCWVFENMGSIFQRVVQVDWCIFFKYQETFFGNVVKQIKLHFSCSLPPRE